MADMLIIRADGNPEIGSGHIMRCSAVAAEAQACGCEVLFAVSDVSSMALVDGRGFNGVVVGGDYREFDVQDADRLANLADERDVTSVLVDSYAVSEGFFARLAERGVACVYIDDAYSFAGGFGIKPVRHDVAAVVNYGFGFDVADYEAAYRGLRTALHVGPEYAPVREGFCSISYAVRYEVESVLVTSGMTNPDRALERMAIGCRMALPDTHITVVVGGSSSFDESCLDGTDYEAIHDARDMPALMAQADLAVSAAGTTLYELACVGVPMVAAPIVENQIGNVRGIRKLGLGKTLKGVGWTVEDVKHAVSELAGSQALRREFSARGRGLIDGRGARRIFDVVKRSAIR